MTVGKYMSDLRKKASEIKEEMNAPLLSISNSNLSDQMEIIKQHAEAVVKASRNESINESQRLSDEKKAKALAKSKVKYD